MTTAIIWSQGMAFCAACSGPLSGEEIDFECCDTCGGDGFDPIDYDEDDDYVEPSSTPPHHGPKIGDGAP